MARILFAWEFGAGLGHLMRLMPIADALHDAGHEAIFAVQNLRTAHDFLVGRSGGGKAYKILPIPHWQAPRDPKASKQVSYSFADVLKLFQYHDAGLLGAMVAGWAGILKVTAPDLVVADFAPTLALARTGGCPMVVLGNGYTIPPPGRRFPAIRPWNNELPAASLAAEERILRGINDVQAARGGPAVDFVADLFSGDQTFVCTIPEFDPYAAYRDRPSLSPFNLPHIEGHPPIESRPEDSVFLYLPADHPTLRVVLEAIAELDLDCDAFVRGLPEAVKAKYASGKRRFYDKPQPLGEILPRMRAIVHHGGLATAYIALLAGTPQLVITRNMEHQVTAHGLTRFKAVRVLTGNRNHSRETVVACLRVLLGAREIRQAAEAAAAALSPRLHHDSVDTVVRACRSRL
jgi:UDP:flavonoid glycosyltransferase YjiC (YdhE family)